jgi:hypothetical protein
VAGKPGPKTKFCPKCGEVKLLSEFRRNKVRRGGWSGYCKACEAEMPSRQPEYVKGYGAAYHTRNRSRRLAVSLAWRENLRSQVIEAYGGACACCGETEEAFLTVDHPNGVPESHKKDGKRMSTVQILKRIRDEGFPDDYRLLCWNCNCGRERNGGVCPHEQRRLTVIEGGNRG